MNSHGANSDVRQLADRASILDCIHRFFRGLDRHDDAVLASAVQPDTVLDYGTLFKGTGAELAKAMRSPSEARWDASQHHLTNHLVEFDPDGDSAHAESYAIIFMRRADRTGVDVTGARYIDRFQRRSEEWKIAARVFVWEWGSEMPAGGVDGVALGFASGTRSYADLSYLRPLYPRGAGIGEVPL
jgi:hypothetical protein